MIHRAAAKGAARRRKTGRSDTGRAVYEALHEHRDRRGHVIGVGERFTVSATGRGGTEAVCRDCRPFTEAVGS